MPDFTFGITKGGADITVTPNVGDLDDLNTPGEHRTQFQVNVSFPLAFKVFTEADVELPPAPTITSVVDDQQSFTGPVPVGGLTNDPMPAVSGVGGISDGVVSISDNGEVIGATNADSTGAWTFNPSSALADGTHSLTATTTNELGTSADSAPHTFTVDSTIPNTPVITDVTDNVGGTQGSVLNGGSTDDARPTVSGTAEPNALVELRNNGVPLAGVNASGSGVWSYTPTSDLALNTYNITAVAFDLAGSASNPSAVRTFTLTSIAGADNIMPSAAQFLSEKVFELSSLDVGMINVVEPWGGSEFGHSYTFALGAGAPSGVTIESDAGVLSNSSALSAGDYTFPVVVTNMKDTTKVSTFYITLHVRQGVTSSRTGDQVLHKDYVVSSGAWTHQPVGNDYSAVLMDVRTAILADQATHGDSNLCATIVFNAGGQYDYDNNRWTFGIQRLKIRTTAAGSKANLRCLQTTPNIATCTLQLGRGWANDMLATGSYIGDASKDNAYFINTVTAGSITVTLKNAADASHFTVGRWVAVTSHDQQGTGFPANVRHCDYAKVVSKSGATITLDRKLRWTHKDNHWENAADINSMGKARLVEVDRNDLRATLRVHMQDINFDLNPNTTVSSETFFYAEALEQYYKNCSFYRFCISQSRHAILDSCTVGESELDKSSTRFVQLGGDSRRDGSYGVYMGTGVELVLQKNHDGLSGYIMPMQYRIIGGTMRAGTYRPISIGGFASRQVIAKGVEFIGGTGSVISNWNPETITVGSGGITYSNGVLTVPSTATNYDKPMRVLFEGGFIYVGSVGSTRYGYVTAIQGNAGNTAHLYNITWLSGAPPVSGEVLTYPKIHELIIDSTCTVSGGCSFNAANYTVKQITPGVATRNFPAGYPASNYGF